MYTREMSRSRKGCFLFLLDQSGSMEEPLGNSQWRKCDELAKAINAWLQNMAIRASGDEGIKDWIDVGVLGYRTDDQGNPIIESALQGPLAGNQLVSIREIGMHPARTDQVTSQVPDDETGELIDCSAEMPIWVDPRFELGTPMCHALLQAHAVLDSWIGAHRESFPPIVINITDGESQDGDPIPYADAVKDLETNDGRVLLFNCHLSMTAADSFLFPAGDELLPDKYSRDLFQMSSVLPEPIVTRARAEGYELEANARGLAYNADMVALLKFLDLGTRVPLR